MKTITPDWTNEGQNKALNEAYYNIINKHYEYYKENYIPKKATEFSLLKLFTEEEGYKSSISMFGGFHGDKYEEGVGLNLFQNYDNLILDIHGAKSGNIAYNGYEYKVSDLIQRLEDTGLIPSNIKQIYTTSCYGGLQEKGVTSNGIPFESSHTSVSPALGISQDSLLNKTQNDIYEAQIEFVGAEMELAERNMNIFLSGKHEFNDDKFNAFIDEQIESYTNQYNEAKNELEKLLKEQYLEKESVSITHNALTDGYITDKYKNNVVDLYNKYNEHFADTKIAATEDEIKNALWYLESENQTNEIISLKKATENSIKARNIIIDSDNNHIQLLEERISLLNGLNRSDEIDPVKDKINHLKEEIEENKNKVLEYNQEIKDYNDKLNEFSERDKLYGKDYKVRRLSSEEAWNKYVTDPNNIPDEFYTSQGFNPTEQKREIFALNSYRKLEEPVDLSLTEEEKLQSLTDAKAYVEDINKDIDKRLDEKYAPKIEETPKVEKVPKIETVPEVETATEESSDIVVDKLKDSVAKESEDVTEKTVEKAEEKVTEEITEKATEETAQLTEKTVGESASNAIKGAEKGLPSWLKVGLMAGAIVGGGSLLVKSAKSKKKEKDKEDYSNYNHSSSKMTMSSGQFLQQRYEMMEDQMLAQSISRYRYGRTG